MSFLAPDKIPFTIVEENPTVESLDDAIDLRLRGGVQSAPDTARYLDPPAELIAGGGSTVTAENSSSEPSGILVTGLGTTVFISGTIDLAATNLGGGAVIIETLQYEEPDFGKKNILFSSNYSDVNGTIDTDKLVGGNEDYTDLQSISDAAGDQIPLTGFTFYGHAGSGDDLLVGSAYNDFLRGGAGSDSISASGGDDLVRGGAGSDEIYLGEGMDTVFYTSDQMNSVDKLWDFSSGEDLITFDSNLDIDSSDIEGLGTAEITVASDSGTVIIQSDDDDIEESDIDFV